MGRFRRRGEAAPSAARQMSRQAEQEALAQRAAALARVARTWEAALRGSWEAALPRGRSGQPGFRADRRGRPRAVRRGQPGHSGLRPRCVRARPRDRVGRDSRAALGDRGAGVAGPDPGQPRGGTAVQPVLPGGLGMSAVRSAPEVRRATIVGMRQIAMVNFDVLMEFELTVLPDGMPPYPASTRQLVGPRRAGSSGPAARWTPRSTRRIPSRSGSGSRTRQLSSRDRDRAGRRAPVRRPGAGRSPRSGRPAAAGSSPRCPRYAA